FVEVVKKYKINTIYHLPAILSARAEENPMRAWEVNIGGLRNALEIAREFECALFVPSSIAAFGPNSPKWKTPQDTIQRPRTMYGVTKVTGELLCDYYHFKYGVDTRGVRYPGLISYKTLPGGGTTDYAVEIFYEALKNKRYTCYLKEDTRLDMMYMPDALKAAMELMEADPNHLVHRNAFNITAMAFTPKELAEEIKKHIPDFKMTYHIDPVKQKIADSWPDMLDDSCARQEWSWNPEYDLPIMVEDMLEKLSEKLGVSYK
ncbi:MAG: NAD-dependent epimerase/dehydratase family protein, partial [Acetomicrobium sp.]